MKALSDESFIKLSLALQVKAIYSEGTFVVAIRYYKYKINLYQLEDYFVEVFYNHKLDRIERMQILSKTTSRMKFYTDQIKLPNNLTA